MPDDPYAEFRKPISTDPYAEFGGRTIAEAIDAQPHGEVPTPPLPAPGFPLFGAPGLQPEPKQGLARKIWELPNTGARQVSEAVPEMATAIHGINPAKDITTQPLDPLAGATSHLIRGAGTMFSPLAAPFAVMSPAAAAVGLGTGLAGGKLARAGAEKLGAGPGTTELAEDVGALGGGALAGPVVARGVGATSRAIGRGLGKTALGLPGRAEAYGATPSVALMEETAGFRPSTIARSARERIADLNTELENRAATSTARPSLQPARDVVAGDISKAAGRNSLATPRELAPMQSFLTEPKPGFTGATEYPPGAYTPISFQPRNSRVLGPGGSPIPGLPTVVRGEEPAQLIAERQLPADLLGMRRQFNADFIRNWNPAANTKGGLGTARRAYHALGNELDAAIPGGSEIDQRISSLIPVAERARLTGLNAGIGQRILNRIARPTGGLVPMVGGYYAGGPLGAVAGLPAAEAAASPMPLMLGARGIYGLGKGLGSPLGVAAARTGVLLRNRRRAEE